MAGAPARSERFDSGLGAARGSRQLKSLSSATVDLSTSSLTSSSRRRRRHAARISSGEVGENGVDRAPTALDWQDAGEEVEIAVALHGSSRDCAALDRLAGP